MMNGHPRKGLEDSLYPEFAIKPKTIFVEDHLTKEYLLSLFPELNVKAGIFVTPGSFGVKRFTEYWSSIDKNRFFGIIDGDYRVISQSNEYLSTNLFQLTVHEIENFMIVPEAISHSEMNKRTERTSEEISRILITYSLQKKWWFAACYVISEIDSRFKSLVSFPANPNLNNIQNKEEVISYILNGGFVQSVVDYLNTMTDKSIVCFMEERIAIIESIYGQENQMKMFPGKELFRHIRGNLHNPQEPILSYDIDLAKEIADYQRNNSQIPDQLVQIKEHISRA